MKNTFYSVKSKKIKNEIKIVHMSDLHGECHGKDNISIVTAIKESSPDFVAMTGDMFSRRDRAFSSTLSLISQISKIAPVYYSFGNHEFVYPRMHAGCSLSDVSMQLSNAGATLLDGEFRDISIGSTDIRVGGIYGYMIKDKDSFNSLKKTRKLSHKTWEEIDRGGKISAFSESFLNTNRFTLLLSHHFEGFLLWGGCEAYEGLDLVLSGHVHGGQAVLPFLGPMFGHTEGLFPKYARGCFKISGSSVIISAGMGNHFIIPRINNPRELVFITLSPDEE